MIRCALLVASLTRVGGRSRFAAVPISIVLRGVAAAACVGIAGAWRGPTVLGLALASGLAFFDLARRAHAESGGDGRRLDWGAAMQLAFLAILCAAAWENRARGGWPDTELVDALGLVIIASGVGLRRSAARALGRQFTVRLSIFDRHQLVSTGPYRWLRHPNYVGLMLIALGTATMVRSPLAALVAVGLWLPITLLQIRGEERVLRRHLDTAYDDYARRSWRLLPGIY
jgi:protein-S-isoprenylcysteine O-methyltransferase Ste14